jgi:hypothetical protein
MSDPRLDAIRGNAIRGIQRRADDVRDRSYAAAEWCDVRFLLAELDRVTAQLTAVDKHLGPWEPEPGSDVGCVGRVQTILNLKADRGELERVTAALRELREAIESDAADRAYATDLGAGEWEAFVGKRTWDALAGGARAAREDK